MNENYEEAINKIFKETIGTYYKEFNIFLSTDKTIKYENTVIMVMGLVDFISTAIYYSIKQLNPDFPTNFDFLKAKIINQLSDSFEKIKKFNPLAQVHVNEIIEKGFIIIN